MKIVFSIFQFISNFRSIQLIFPLLFRCFYCARSLWGERKTISIFLLCFSPPPPLQQWRSSFINDVSSHSRFRRGKKTVNSPFVGGREMMASGKLCQNLKAFYVIIESCWTLLLRDKARAPNPASTTKWNENKRFIDCKYLIKRRVKGEWRAFELIERSWY